MAFGDRPRAAIVTQREIKIIPLPHLSGKDLACGLWTLDKEKILVCSVYMEQLTRGIEIDLAQLAEVTSYAKSKGHGLIISGDTNAHSPVWGNDKYDQNRGASLENFIIEKELCILNDGSPTWRNRRYTTRIDLTLVNGKLKNKCTGWEAKFVFSISEHALIRMTIDREEANLVTIVTSTDKKSFKENLKGVEWTPPKKWNPYIIDAEAKKLTSLITDRWELFSKRKKTKPFKLDWWDDEIIESNGACAMMAGLAKTDEDAKVLKHMRKEHKKLKGKKQSEAWNKMVSKMVKAKDLARLTKEGRLGNKLGLLRKSDGTLSDESEVRGMLLDEHAPGSYQDGGDRQFRKTSSREHDLRKLKFMTTDLLRAAFKEFGANKRGGAGRANPENAESPPGGNSQEDANDYETCGHPGACSDSLD